jgi:hypothetical protein
MCGKMSDGKKDLLCTLEMQSSVLCTFHDFAFNQLPHKRFLTTMMWFQSLFSAEDYTYY